MRLSERRTDASIVLPSLSIIGEANKPYYYLLYLVINRWASLGGFYFTLLYNKTSIGCLKTSISCFRLF